MLNIVVLVFVGGAVGAIAREALMLSVPEVWHHFPLPIFLANITASFLLGLTTGLHQRRALSDNISAMIGTGIMGGLSTFSSFVFGAFVLMSAPTAGFVVALIYVLASVGVGYAAVSLGLKIGAGRVPLQPQE
ncbi:CrcB family protein [Roseomonas fluvialis]|uniref:Fluoride-specific ion channel FluC n=1 Tax=Roseomonas fluvialis TaxID=1750527 RepID=A0ABN6P734_9PROT|nr:CrcB family protein [Roseomonas fluvialis]BDG73512.1 putative fluoride ion transporter CrcB 2 [Roseomonas fluvialis]